MEKTNLHALSEIVIQDTQNINTYLENAFTLMMRDFMQVSSGVIFGLAGSLGGNTVTIASGSVFNGAVFGQLEGAGSGIVVSSFPASGTRVDLISATYLEVTDTPGSGYVLADVTTRIESVTTQDTRKFGSVVIARHASTTAATCPAGKIPLYEVTCDTTHVVSIADVRIYSAMQRLVTDTKTLFYGTFFAGIR